jgi:acetyl esterase/lipase
VSGQGGHLLNPAYFTPKPYLQKKLLGTYKKYSTRNSAEFLGLKVCSDFPWDWQEKRGKKATGEVPEIGSRPWLSSMASVTGARLDFLTGKQGFSKMLLEAYSKDNEVDLAALVPQDLKVLFPELMIGKEFPPSFVLHGTGDKNVVMRESEKTVKELERMDVECEFVAAENWGHGWSAEVWKRWGKDIVPFFEKCIIDKT